MARTPLFSRLQRTFRMILWGQQRGLTDPAALREAYEKDAAERRPRSLERRSFLKAGAATIAAAAVPGTLLTACDDEVTPPKPEEVIAIVGGGMAGVHCAFRLKEKGIKATIYEAQDRIGGRMYSARGKFKDSQVCELGGELIDTGHTTLRTLAGELGLDLDDRFAEPSNIQTDTWFVNGAEVPDATLVQQFTAVAPVFLAAYNEEDEAKIAALDTTDLDTWLKANVPVATYPELHAVLQTAYRGEFGLENVQQTSLNLVYFIDSMHPEDFAIFGDSDERYHTHTGNDAFPTLLADKLDPAQIEFKTKLLAARDATGGGYEIDLLGPTGDKTTKKVTRIVFALPFTILREVDLTGLKLTDEKKKIIAELGYGTNAKVMAGFDTRVWRTVHMANGSLTTDMPVQQTWETSIGQAGESGILTNFLGGDQGVKSGTGTENEWVEGVLPNLEIVWPGITAAYSGVAIRMHWPTVPTMKGSYACYKPGQYAFFGLEGKREGNLHFCGEHTSQDFQGYMEGAAETGALVAAEILDDLGIAHSQGLSDVLGPKLLVPQACYGADRFPRLDRRARRALIRSILRAHYALDAA